MVLPERNSLREASSRKSLCQTDIPQFFGVYFVAETLNSSVRLTPNTTGISTTNAFCNVSKKELLKIAKLLQQYVVRSPKSKSQKRAWLIVRVRLKSIIEHLVEFSIVGILCPGHRATQTSTRLDAFQHIAINNADPHELSPPFAQPWCS